MIEDDQNTHFEFTFSIRIDYETQNPKFITTRVDFNSK